MNSLYSSVSYLRELDDLADRCDLSWLSGQTILISGATGMVGSYLIDLLLRWHETRHTDVHVIGLGRSTAKAAARFCRYVDDSAFEFVAADINNPLPALPERIDYVIHAASNTHPLQYATDPVGTILSNTIGTRNMLDQARDHRVKRFMFLSSVEIYGENRSDRDAFTEQDCGYIDCNTLRAGYPESKRVGEALCQAYRKQYGLDAVIIRLPRLFGPTLQPNDSKALSQFIRNAVKDEPIVLKSAGTQYYSYLYTADAVNALLKVLQCGGDGEAYNAADSRFDIHLYELAELIAASRQSKVVYEIPSAVESNGFSKATKAVMNADKLRALGWTIDGTIRDRIETTVRILGEIEWERDDTGFHK